MNFWLRGLLDRFDLLSVRERLLVLVAALALIVTIWDTALSAPRERERKARRQQVEALRDEVSGLEQSIQAIVAQGENDPDRTLREEIAKLQQEIAAQDARLAGATTGLIGPEEMTQVLRQLLRRAAHLEMRALRTLKASPVLGAEGDSAAPESKAKIYKHGLELELAGSYLDVLRFLQAMEALQWRFFWDRIDLQVEQHPQARVRLVVYTLSLEEGWIGV